MNRSLAQIIAAGAPVNGSQEEVTAYLMRQANDMGNRLSNAEETIKQLQVRIEALTPTP